MLKTKVIVSHVTNLSNARYAAGMGVDFIGFSLNAGSKYYVTAADVNTIREWLSGVSIIGEVSDKNDSDGYKVDYLQITDANTLNAFDEPIFEVRVDQDNIQGLIQTLATLAEKVAFFILNLRGLESKKFAKELEEACIKYQCYLAADFTPENINDFLALAPTGIVLFGTPESKPGLSTYDGIADILELLEEN